jgi:hypothetical protein
VSNASPHSQFAGHLARIRITPNPLRLAIL